MASAAAPIADRDAVALPADQRAKWLSYYANDLTSAPWDTHEVSSQLRSYLCACPASHGVQSSDGLRGPSPRHAAAQAVSAEGTAATAGGGEVSGSARDAAGAGGDGAAGPHLHVCEACAPLRPPAFLAWSRTRSPVASPSTASASQRLPSSPSSSSAPPLCLELCCGTGGSLAFLHGLGMSAVGVELVEAAARLAAQRLAAAGAAARGGSDEAAAVEVVPIREPRPKDSTTASTSPAPHEPITTAIATAPGAGPSARVMAGDLFAAGLPAGAFAFAYDCQGLHAMPPALRPAYVGVLRAALGPGGVALLLLGRDEGAEAEAQAKAGGKEAEGSGTRQRSEEAGTAERVEGAAGVREAGEQAAGSREDGAAEDEGQAVEAGAESVRKRRRSGGEAAEAAGPPAQGSGGQAAAGSGRKGPALLRRPELEALFPAGEWEWLRCEATRFDLTPAYARMPAPPPAWSLLVRRL
ncbi:hypothetical protein HYH03_016767 [Edaphochlamys debaryana]|uniref:Methyltransferase domain-containing protein n=1 Tax=Edaphochlamys debaryana TaxID=47281 RepID=A0A836BR72_9CHLO|nr:hypothetical protein HYH03_016767 [Edaphochlamys debaryana]|eukprot:KAG2484348.1 hypothetical protein HYH03_016767 [Edaphochlamys debaryana]